MAQRAPATSAHQSCTYRVPLLSVTSADSTAALTQEQADGRAESPYDAPHQSPAQPYRGLSDEVLAQIFEEIHSAYQDEYIAVPPLAYLAISKRLHNIARPIWLSSISTRDGTESSDRFIAKLLTDAPLRPLVRQLELKFCRAFSQSQIALLTVLDNLRILKVSFDKSWPKGYDGAKILPATLLDAIASRPHLEKLDFSQLIEVKHPVPEPVNKRPLRAFSAPIHSIGDSMLEYLTVRRVKTLRLTVCLNYDSRTGDLPWENLSSVWFDVGTLKNGSVATCDVPEALGRQLLARGNPKDRLLNVGVFFESKAPYFGRVLRAFLDAFAPRRTHFTVQSEGTPDLHTADHDNQEPWNLIEAFRLQAPYALTEGRNLADLAAFLNNMPAVEDVSLRQVKLIASNKGPRTPAPIPVSALQDSSLGIEYPHLAGLLAHISRSKITRFEITSPSEPGPLRWVRETAKDPLVRVGSLL